MKTSKIFISTCVAAGFLFATNLTAQTTSASNTLSGTAPNPTQYVGSANAYDLIFKTNNAEKMRIINRNGNLNIGPILNTQQTGSAKLTINPATTFNLTADNLIGLSIAKQLNSSYSRAIFFVPHAIGGHNWMTQSGDCTMYWTDGGNGVTGSGNQNATSGFVIAPFSAAFSGIRITAAGNVGIGTPLINNPNNYKLAVNGTIGAKSVTIETTSTAWPDYVFDSKYNLKSITELEAFLKTNKHLPNVPSACEVETNGYDVSTMNANLLEKIEELTLYVIEQQKQIQELKANQEKLASQK